jgi:hypothetical protein
VRLSELEREVFLLQYLQFGTSKAQVELFIDSVGAVVVGAVVEGGVVVFIARQSWMYSHSENILIWIKIQNKIIKKMVGNDTKKYQSKDDPLHHRDESRICTTSANFVELKMLKRMKSLNRN